MKHIITAGLIATSALVSCNIQHNKHTQQELGTVLNLPMPTTDSTQTADFNEEFVANGGTAHGDTTSVITDSADIYYEEFIKPGPH